MEKNDLFSKIIIWMKKSFEIILGIEKLIHKIIEYPLQALNLTVSTAPIFSFFIFLRVSFHLCWKKILV